MKKIFAILFIMLGLFSICFAKEKVKVSSKDFGVYVFKINAKKYGKNIKPVVVEKLTTPQKLYDDCKYELVVNGGFFDVKTGESVSYVVIDDELKGNVEKNKDLMENLEKQNRKEKVLSRGELRILENKRHKLKFEIARHNAPIKKGYKIKHLLQAGPIILPDMDLEGEGFVQYDEKGLVVFQSVDILKRRERTALALKGKNLYIVLFTKDYRVDANEMRDYMLKKLKLKNVLALDGGLSTAINHKDISIGSFGKKQRKVKSFLVVE